MPQEEMKDYLLKHELIDDDDAEVIPMEGGVSSEIYLVKETFFSFVVKKALPKLNVEADWYADVSRNETEQAYMNYVRKILPGVAPEIIHSDPEEHLFTMEFLGKDFVNWKTQLLNRQVMSQHTHEAARILGTIHRESWEDPNLKQTFAKAQDFYDLRLEPYFLTTAEKHLRLKYFIERESQRLSNTHQCLVHGDFSPKNIMLSKKRLVLLDCEAACFGDPAFDVAFFMNHLLLKSLLFVSNFEPYVAQLLAFRNVYRRTLGPNYHAHHLERRICHLLPILLLARVDGKSPVEYLDDEAKKKFIRIFATKTLLARIGELEPFIALWEQELDFFPDDNHE